MPLCVAMLQEKKEGKEDELHMLNCTPKLTKQLLFLTPTGSIKHEGRAHEQLEETPPLGKQREKEEGPTFPNTRDYL